nr:immunoglobulin light chain junction region [Macaca mulatta]MOV77752.1 immunoglobulin light chain junction region [Macaca mulatta]MOV77824.1 immunoglobulin light chain junction region [Macaca mulatta]MOV78344.1 immunoglobulin light chain junction region [Macaca mulatta]MOV81769.1 immunoglobulin light chain junction region [Macaca mulatta]
CQPFKSYLSVPF